MTNDEFEGHLLAALHGPNAGKIAARVAAIVLEDRPTMESVAEAAFEAHSSAHDGEFSLLMALASIAVVDSVGNVHRPVDQIMREVTAKAVAQKIVKGFLAGKFDSESSDVSATMKGLLGE